MKPTATRIMLVVAALFANVLVWSHGSPVSADDPPLAVSKSGPSTILAGERARFTLTATNPGAVPQYNLSFRDVLAPGVTYQSMQPPTLPAPIIETNQVELPVGSGEFVSQQTLIWSNVADLQPGDSFALTFDVNLNETPSVDEPNLPVYVVGSSFDNTGEAFASPNPRRLPGFTSTGEPIADPEIDTATSGTVTTTKSAIEISKAEPSPEGELLRGVHDNVTEYTLQVRVTNQGDVTDAVISDYLPAGLEFLGCNDVDNSSAVEFPGAPDLGAGPVVDGCTFPDLVETVANPEPGLTGVYTRLTWFRPDLTAGSTVTLRYAAAIPLRANELFADPAPTPGSGLQASNLDNNTGASTRELADEASVTNVARVVGEYQGPIEGGGPTTVESESSVSRSVEDVRMRKAVSPDTFDAGERATYTITIDTSEYTNAAGIALDDRIPNGICPLFPGVNYAEPVLGVAPAECDGELADQPTVSVDGGTPAPIAFESVTEDTANGGFDVVFGPLPGLEAGSTAVVTYYGRMRTTYAFGDPDGAPPVSGDGFTNTVELSATTSPIDDTGESGEQTVTDGSGATQQSTSLTLGKTILPRTVGLFDAGDPCPATGYVDPTDPLVEAEDVQFRLGDRVCFRLRVDFASSIATRNAVVTDFLPVGVEYEPGSAFALPGSAPVTFNEAAATAGTETPTWLVGDPDGGGNTFVAPGGVFDVVLAGRVVDIPDGDSPEVRGNLMKLRTENTAGQARSFRDELEFQIVPAAPVRITKGVASVDDPPFATTEPDQDGIDVVEGSRVTYRIDLTHDADPSGANSYSIRGLDVWDALPPGVTCDQVESISNLSGDTNGGPVLGVCTDPGDVDHPTFNATVIDEAATRSAIRWRFPTDPEGPLGVDRWRISVGQTRTLTYDVIVPSPTSLGVTLVNDASVRSYEAFTNELNVEASYFPADNVDVNVDEDDWNAPTAADPSSVVTPEATVTKTGITSIDEPGNNLPDQAVPGELITYTYSVVVPAETSVFEGVLSDTFPTNRLVLLSTPAPVWRFYPDATSSTIGTEPGGFTLAGDGTLTFPATYTNSTVTPQRFEVEVTARVLNTFSSQETVENTATFRSLDAVGGAPLDPVEATYEVDVHQISPGLTKTADATLVTGDQVVTYTLRATNPSTRPTAHDVWITDCIPAGLTFESFGSVSGTPLGPFPGGSEQSDGVTLFTNTCPTSATFIAFGLDALAPGANVPLTYSVRVDLTAVGGEIYTNAARLRASTLDDGDTNPFVDPNPTERTVTRNRTFDVTVPGAGEAKTASPDRATIGETVTYTVRATIPRNTNFFQAAAVDVLPTGLDPDSLQFLGSECLRLTTPTETCALAATLMPNTVPVAGGEQIGFLIGDITGDPFERVVTIRYAARVANIVENERGVVLTNAAFAAWDSDDTGAVPDSPSYTWQNRDDDTLTADVTVLEPDVVIGKSVSNDEPEPGETFTYTVRLENSDASTSAAAHDLVVADVIPVGVRVSGPSIVPAPAAFVQPTETTPGLIRWELPGPIEAGGVLELRYDAQLAPSPQIDDTPQINTADLTEYYSLPTGSDGRRRYEGNEAQATVTPQFPELTLVKSVVNDPPAYLEEPVTWQIVVTNDGGGRAFAVEVQDVLPPNWAYVDGSTTVVAPGGTTDPNPVESTLGVSQQLTWASLGALEPDESLTITFDAIPLPDVVLDPGVGSAVPQHNTATATAFDGSGAEGNLGGDYVASDDATTRIDAVDLVIDKFHDDPPVAGAPFDWTIRVTNDSTTDTAVGDFVVTDTLPTTSGVSFVSASGPGWTCSESTGTVTCTRGGSLAPGASLPDITIRVETVPDLVDELPVTITNTASVAGRTHDTNLDNNTDSDPATVTTSADLAIAKGLATPLIAGETATYEVDVTNLGPSVSRADATNPITVVDDLPGGVSFVSASGADWVCDHDGVFPGGVVTCDRVGDLPPGPAPTISIVVSVPASASDELENVATVSPGTTLDPNDLNDVAIDETEIDAEADLALAKSALGPFVAGATTVYRLRVDNLGPSDAQGVEITDDLPTGLTFASASSVTGSWTCGATAEGFTCDLDGTLAAGGSATVDVTVDVASSVLGEVTNTAVVGSTTTDRVLGNNDAAADAVFVGVADLTVTKTSSGAAAPGGPVEWTVTVTNLGPSDSQGTITVTDTLPDGLIGPVDASGPGWVCDVTGLDLECTRAAALVDAASADLTITAVVDPASPGPESFTNTAIVTPGPTTDPDTGNNSATDVVDLVEPDVTLAKTVDDPTPQPGDVFTYTISLTNDADAGADAFELTVTDEVPPGIEVDTSMISDGGAYDVGSRTITWTLVGPLAPGATLDLTYDASLADSSTIDDDSLTNTATLASYESQPTGGRPYVGNDGSATVTPRFPALTATKTALGPTPTYIGDEFAWEITITNTGDGTATTVDVVDTLPDNWVYVDDSTVVTPASGSPTFPDPDDPIVAPELRWTNVGSLQPDQTLTVTFRAVPTVDVVTSPGVGSGIAHVNSVFGAATDPTGATGNLDGDYRSNTADASARIDAADLVITKSSSGTAVAGEELAWTVLVANADGVDTAVGPFTVTDTLPAGVTLVGAVGEGWSCSGFGDTVTCNRTEAGDTLDAGAAFEPIEITVLVDPDTLDEIVNTAIVTGLTHELDPDTNTDTDRVDVVGEADLAIEKTRSGTLVAGEPVTYEVIVTNTGPSVSRGPITVTDTLPDSTTFDGWTGIGWDCTHDDASVGGDLVCTYAADLAVGAPTPALVITATVAADVAPPDQVVNVVSITETTTFDPNDLNDEASATGTPGTSADISLDKASTGELVAGREAVYRFRVDNAGPSDAAATVHIVDDLPVGLTFVSSTSIEGDWTCTPDDPDGTAFTCDLTGPLAAGAFATVDVTVLVASDVTDPIENTATVSSPTDDPFPGNNTDTDNSEFDAVADLGITKSSPGTAVAGTALTWTLLVTNEGPSDSQPTITVTDVLPAGVTFTSATGDGWLCDHDDAPEGGVVTCTRDTVLVAGADAPEISIVVDVLDDAGPTTLVNRADVAGTTEDRNDDNDRATDEVVVTDQVDLTIEKTAAPDPVRAGEQVTYTIVVVNDGPSTADDVVVTDSLPAGLTVASVDGSADDWDCDAPTAVTIECTLPSLPPFDPDDPSTTRTITVVTDVATGTPDGTILTNLAEVATSSPVINPGDDTSSVDVEVIAEADLSVVKTHDDDVVPAGGQVTFDIAVANAGPSDAVAPIRVVDTLPAGFSYVGSTGPWSCEAAGQDITCTLDATVLIADTSAPPLAITVQVDPSLDDGTLTNAVVVSSPTVDPEESNDSWNDDVEIVRAADLSITKVHDADAVRIGDELDFELEVTNAGPSEAREVVVTDTVPGGLTLLAADGDGWACTVAAPTATCELTEPLAAGTAAPAITVTVRVDPGAFPGVVNSASVSSETTDPDTTNNAASDEVTVPRLVDLTIDKSHAGDVTVGKDVVFTLLVGNDGPLDETELITVTDVLPTGLTPVSVISPDATCTITGQTVTCTKADGLAVDETFSIEVTATVEPAAYPAATNTATVSSPTEDADPTNDTDTDTITVPPLVDLAITKTHTGTVAVGGTVTYSVTVRNLGPTADPGPATVTDTLPSSLTPRTATGAGLDCTISGQTVTCRSTAPLAVDATVSATITADVAAAAFPTVENTATVTTPSAETDTTNNTATDVAPVVPLIRLDVTKQVVAQDDDLVVWGIRVRNTGLNPTTQAIVVTDPLAPGLQFVSASGDGWTCTGTTTVRCSFSGQVDPGASTTELRITTRLVGTPGTTVTNVATAEGGGPDTESVTADSSVVTPGDLPDTGSEPFDALRVATMVAGVGVLLWLTTRRRRAVVH